MKREKLPTDRAGTTTHFTILSRVNEKEDGSADLLETKGYITANAYPKNGKLGEFFVRVGKAGSSTSWLDAWAVSCSIALQQGATVEEIMSKFVGWKFEPSGTVKHLSGIDRCTSMVDMVSRFLLSKYGVPDAQADH